MDRPHTPASHRCAESEHGSTSQPDGGRTDGTPIISDGSLRVMEAALIAFATTAATLSVTIVLALLEFRRRREAVQSRREQIVGRVLDTLERATRAASRAPIAGWWAPNELEYALLLPRLLAELPEQGNAVAIWVARRI